MPAARPAQTGRTRRKQCQRLSQVSLASQPAADWASKFEPTSADLRCCSDPISVEIYIADTTNIQLTPEQSHRRTTNTRPRR